MKIKRRVSSSIIFSLLLIFGLYLLGCKSESGEVILGSKATTRRLTAQQAYVKASNAGTGDSFGYAVAISGETIVIGASGEDSNATSINGDESDDSVTGAGAAYVLYRTGDTWAQQAYLKASNTGSQDQFGRVVAISGDTIVVGAVWESSDATGVNGDGSDDSANRSGAAYVFHRTGDTWAQQAYLKASNTHNGDYFGSAVAISGDTIVIGATGEDSDATGVGGDESNDTAPNAGAAYVFHRANGSWTQQAYLKASNTGASDNFGSAIAISGDTIVVGATSEDSNATGVNGNESDNSADNAGAAYVFHRTSGSWAQQAYLKASNTGASDNFGIAVSISGDTIVVGASFEDSDATGVNGSQGDNTNDTGAAYVFHRTGGTWTQQAYLKASNTGRFDRFGYSVTISGNAVVVGAYFEDSNATGLGGNETDNSLNKSGAAYLFYRTGTTWTQHAYLKASNTRAYDYFGQSVAIDRDTVVAGAHGEDSDATGITNGTGSSGTYTSSNSGSAYIFK